jgi:hypothetical protein
MLNCYYVMKWSDTAVWAHGPFGSRDAAGTWGLDEKNNPGDDPRWHVMYFPAGPPVIRTFDVEPVVTRSDGAASQTASADQHPMLGRRCLIRTYSAGIHIGDVEAINGMEVHLKNALRLWKWEGGGLSISAVAANGIRGGRLNRTGEVYLTNTIEMIPTSAMAEATYVKFIED